MLNCPLMVIKYPGRKPYQKDKRDYVMTFYAIYNRFFSWPLRTLLLVNILFPIAVVLDSPDTDRIPAVASAFLGDMLVFGLPVAIICVICLFMMLIREIRFSRDSNLLINENKPNLGILMLDLILLTSGVLVAGIYSIFIYFALTLSFRSSV